MFWFSAWTKCSSKLTLFGAVKCSFVPVSCAKTVKKKLTAENKFTIYCNKGKTKVCFQRSYYFIDITEWQYAGLTKSQNCKKLRSWALCLFMRMSKWCPLLV